MKYKIQTNLSIKLILILCFFLLSIILIILLKPSSSPPLLTAQTLAKQTQQVTAATTAHTCTKIPATLVQTLLHYATSTTTPQQTLKEISVTARVLEARSPCNFLVFGLGHDSPMWAALNHGGRTIFLEEDAAWIETIRKQFPQLESYHVKYDTRVTMADELMVLARQQKCRGANAGELKNSECRLALKGLPSVFYEEEWDLIMVDAPTGWIPEAPGRMGAIYTAGMAARGRKEGGSTDVFVHDVDRIVEDKFSKELLCEGYLKEQEGRLRHFTIPSHRNSSAMPFCP